MQIKKTGTIADETVPNIVFVIPRYQFCQLYKYPFQNNPGKPSAKPFNIG